MCSHSVNDEVWAIQLGNKARMKNLERDNEQRNLKEPRKFYPANSFLQESSILRSGVDE